MASASDLFYCVSVFTQILTVVNVDVDVDVVDVDEDVDVGVGVGVVDVGKRLETTISVFEAFLCCNFLFHSILFPSEGTEPLKNRLHPFLFEARALKIVSSRSFHFHRQHYFASSVSETNFRPRKKFIS